MTVGEDFLKITNKHSQVEWCNLVTDEVSANLKRAILCINHPDRNRGFVISLSSTRCFYKDNHLSLEIEFYLDNNKYYIDNQMRTILIKGNEDREDYITLDQESHFSLKNRQYSNAVISKICSDVIKAILALIHKLN